VLTEPDRTPYDLRFRLLGFPVRVHPWFWIGTVLFGSSSLNFGLQFLAIWVLVVFVSILVHEFGHALAFRLYGADADIILYAFGGLAVPTMAISGRWRRVFISLAGPFAGFVLCGIVFGSDLALRWVPVRPFDEAGRLSELWFLYDSLIFVNLYWGIFNLLPVYPLDGGHVCRELCGMVWGPRGQKISLKISLGVAILLVVYSIICVTGVSRLLDILPSWFPTGTFYTAILFALLAYTSYQLLTRIEWTDTHWDDRSPYDR
jgi:stage IV sporulation protein FB